MCNSKFCVLASSCKIAGSDRCNVTCFPYVVTHGADGKGGLWGSTGVPPKYRHCNAANLSIIQQQNPAAYQTAKMYLGNVLEFVGEGVGLYLYAVPAANNPKGTGTGKTTTAATILNEYVKQRIIQHVKGEKRLEGVQPGVFVRMSEFQNQYNLQFRGTVEGREAATTKFHNMKRLMSQTELLVMDDIGLRDANTLVNEIYEIIDHRNNEEGKATIVTSNLPIQKIGETLSDQIASRLEAMCELVPFKGKDNRKKVN